MREYFRDDEVRSFWNKLLESKSEDISRINSSDSKDKTLTISYEEMDKIDMNFALLFLRYPEEYLNLLKDVLYGHGEEGKKGGLLSEDFMSRKDARVRI